MDFLFFWSIFGMIAFLIFGGTGKEATWAQVLFVCFLCGPVAFIIFICIMIYDLLGEIGNE